MALRNTGLISVLFAFLVSVFAASCAFATDTLLVLGDSLSAGYGIPQEKSWPTLMQQRLTQQGKDYRVINASISGETTAGGKSRLPALLEKHQPAIVIIALGANDGLRGLSLSEMRRNLMQMVGDAQAQKARTLLVAMRLPPNFGGFSSAFYETFAKVAEAKKLPSPPFLLEGIGHKPQYFQADMLHPTQEAQIRLLDNVWPALAPLID